MLHMCVSVCAFHCKCNFRLLGLPRDILSGNLTTASELSVSCIKTRTINSDICDRNSKFLSLNRLVVDYCLEGCRKLVMVKTVVSAKQWCRDPILVSPDF